MITGELAKYRIDDRLREAERERIARAVRRKVPGREPRRDRARWSFRLRRLASLLTASSV